MSQSELVLPCLDSTFSSSIFGDRSPALPARCDVVTTFTERSPRMTGATGGVLLKAVAGLLPSSSSSSWTREATGVRMRAYKASSCFDMSIVLYVRSSIVCVCVRVRVMGGHPRAFRAAFCNVYIYFANSDQNFSF